MTHPEVTSDCSFGPSVEATEATFARPLGASGENILHNVAMHLGQTAFQAVVIVREPFVIQAHEVEERGVEVVDRCFVDGGLESEFVAFPVAEGAFDSGSCEEARKRVRVVISAGSVGLQEGHAAELGAPHDEGVLSMSRCLRSAMSAAVG